MSCGIIIVLIMLLIVWWWIHGSKDLLINILDNEMKFKKFFKIRNKKKKKLS